MSKTINEVKSWLNSKVGQQLDYDGIWPGECYDLYNFYCDFVGVPKAPGGYAYQIWDNYDRSAYTAIPNSRDLVARAGDVVVWGVAINGYAGHVAIANGEGDKDYFVSLDQNWNSKTCQFIRHDWNHVLGVLRPKTVVDNKALAGNYRVVAGDGARFRKEPKLTAEVTHTYNTGDEIEMKGYVTDGDAVNGNKTWFVSKVSGVYASAEIFTDKGTHDLANLTKGTTTDSKVRTLAYDGVAFRTGASTVGTEVKQRWNTGDEVEMKGYVCGQELNLNGIKSNIWFVSKISGLYSWSGFYSDRSVTGLSDLTPAAQENKPVAETPKVEGLNIIDVSAFQGEISFAQVKAAGVDGVIIRAGHVGKSYGGNDLNHDPTHDTNTKKAREAGLLVGHYWYCYQALDPVAEAKKFMSADIRDGEPVFIDAEEKDLTKEWVDTFAQTIKDISGMTAIYYDYTANLNTKAWVDGDIWQADYTEVPGSYGKVRNLNVIMHQYTSSGSVDGISGRVDKNIYFGKAADWRKLGKCSNCGQIVPPSDTQEPEIDTGESDTPTYNPPVEPHEQPNVEELNKLKEEYMDEFNNLVSEAGKDFNFSKPVRMTAYFIGDALLLAGVETPLITTALTASDPTTVATAIASALFTAGVGILTVFKLAKK